MNRQFKLLVILFCLVSASAGYCAQTWKLEKGGGIKTVSDSNDNGYSASVANIKQLINDGKVKKAKAAVEKFKKDFPQFATEDFNAFMKGEILFAKGDFQKAVKAYDDFLDKYPQSDFADAAWDREFAIGNAYINGRKLKALGIFKFSGYDTGVKIMDRITDRAGDSMIAKKAALTVVESMEKKNNFVEAFDKWSQISSRWPTGEIGKRALLGMARSKHAIYRGPKFNATSLVSAKSYYENFVQRYPEDANQLTIPAKIVQINEQLAYKQYSIGKFYQRTGSLDAANLYYNMTISDWPQTTAAKMAREQMETIN